MKKVSSMESLVGNSGAINYVKGAIAGNYLPDFIIIEGKEGIGKTSLAKLIAAEFVKASEADRKTFIEEGRNTANMKLYRMSLESSLELMNTMIEELRSSLTGKSVYILDEAHRMSDKVQDAILSDAEFIPASKRIILCTTDITKLSKPLLSRGYLLELNPPTKEELKSLVRDSIRAANLRIENENLFIELLVSLRDKPRAALKVVEAMGSNRVITLRDYNLFVKYEDVSVYKELLNTFNSSPVYGLYLLDSVESIEQLLMFSKAVLLYKEFSQSVTKDLSSTNVALYNKKDLAELENVKDSSLITFIKYLSMGLAKKDKDDKHLLTASYLLAHETKLQESNTKLEEDSYSMKYAEKMGATETSSVQDIANRGKTVSERTATDLRGLISNARKVKQGE